MFDALIEALKVYGLPGLGVAALVLVGVYLARRGGLVVGGDTARLANVALAAVLSGLSGDPQADRALLAAVSSVLAALMYELLKFLGNQLARA